MLSVPNVVFVAGLPIAFMMEIHASLKPMQILRKHRGNPKTFPYILEVHPPGKEG